MTSQEKADAASDSVRKRPSNESPLPSEAEPVRFLLISGKPIREPIAWHGPIVMNTQEELRIAFEELERKTFIK